MIGIIGGELRCTDWAIKIAVIKSMLLRIYPYYEPKTSAPCAAPRLHIANATCHITVGFAIIPQELRFGGDCALNRIG